MPGFTHGHAKPESRLPAGWVFTAREPQEDARQPTILVLDNLEPHRAVLKTMVDPGRYRILEAPLSGNSLDAIENEKVDLVVLDFMPPEEGGPDLCRRIKANRKTRFVPVLMVSNRDGVEPEIEGIDSGADEVLIRPLDPAVVRARIGLMLRHKALLDSLEDTESILFALAQAIEQRDRNAMRHCERLATIGVALGRALGLPGPDVMALQRGGYLHDIGKVSVPDAVLFKAGPLTAEEWQVMREHTVRGEEICRGVRTLSAVIPIIRSHHERWDGSGYPDGLRGDGIPLLARILQVADVYDALISVRPYKETLRPTEAMEVLEQESRRGWRDPEMVKLFRAVWQEPPGFVRYSLENMREALAC